MSLLDLAVLVLQQIGAVAVQHSGAAGAERGCVAAGFDTFAGRLDADHIDAGIVKEGMKEANRIRAATNAGD